MQSRWISALVLVAILVSFRIAGSVHPFALPNFQPLCAMFLCSMACQRGRLAWALPLLAWAASLPVTNWLNGTQPFAFSGGLLTVLCCLLAVGGVGFLLRGRATAGPLLAASAGAAVLFHLVTNTAAWLADPSYARTAGGYLQAVWTGRPEDVLPTWVFLRNLFAANLFFTALFLLALRFPALAEKQLAAVPSPR